MENKFKEAEKIKHTKFFKNNGIMLKNSTELFQANDNLYSEIRNEAINYFKTNRIAWHNNNEYSRFAGNSPDPCLYDSSVYLVNLLFIFNSHKKELLTMLQKIIRPDIVDILEIENNTFIAFEWSGKDNNGNANYLSEIFHDDRGLNTGFDAAILVELRNKQKMGLFIEFKYTQLDDMCCQKKDQEYITKLLKTYDKFINNNSCPLNNNIKNNISYRNFFGCDTLSQLIRQQLLATQIKIKDKLDQVCVINLIPNKNIQLNDPIVGKNLFDFLWQYNICDLNKPVREIWKQLLVRPEEFRTIFIEDLWESIPSGNAEILKWKSYMDERYRIA